LRSPQKSGNAIGPLAISFTEESICGIAGNMLGGAYKDICRDVFDAVGEITNTISGVAETYMEKD
jgi:CheY-specific phosphatase CheX